MMVQMSTQAAATRYFGGPRTGAPRAAPAAAASSVVLRESLRSTDASPALTRGSCGVSTIWNAS